MGTLEELRGFHRFALQPVDWASSSSSVHQLVQEACALKKHGSASA
jgi:hypothetical protein